jgi:hypothetical protein
MICFLLLHMSMIFVCSFAAVSTTKASSSQCSLIGSYHRAEKQEFAGGTMGVHGDLNLHFFDSDQLRLNFDVVLRAFGEDERCIVAARGSWRLERDGRVRIAIAHCEARDASGDLRVPSRSSMNPLASQVGKVVLVSGETRASRAAHVLEQVSHAAHAVARF